MQNIEHRLWVPIYYNVIALFGSTNLWHVERYDFFDGISVTLAVACKYVI